MRSLQEYVNTLRREHLEKRCHDDDDERCSLQAGELNLAQQRSAVMEICCDLGDESTQKCRPQIGNFPEIFAALQ